MCQTRRPGRSGRAPCFMWSTLFGKRKVTACQAFVAAFNNLLEINSGLAADVGLCVTQTGSNKSSRPNSQSRRTHCAGPKNSENQNKEGDRQPEFCFPGWVKRPFLLKPEKFRSVQKPGNCPEALESSKKSAKSRATASLKTPANEYRNQGEWNKIERKQWPQDKSPRGIPVVLVLPREICVQFRERDPDPIQKYQ